MKRMTLTAVCLAIALPAAGAAVAQQHQHGQGAISQNNQCAEMQPASGSMMQMMKGHMQMMSGMMDGGVMGKRSPMGHVFMAMLDANGDGETTAEEARTQLQNILEENDANVDGNLSIDEFEAFHSRMMREKMVDRFQHLDADGDGAITTDEMAAPAKKIERKQKKMKMMGATQE